MLSSLYVLCIDFWLWIVSGLGDIGILLTALAEWVIPKEFFGTFQFCETLKIEPMTTVQRRNPVLSTMDCLRNTLFPERSWVGSKFVIK